MSTQTDVQEMYIGLLGRAADKAGYDYWVAEIDAGILTVEDVRANIVNEQPEYLNGIGAMTRSQGVNQLYINLFGRPAEPAGLEYWVNGEGSSVNFDQLVLALIDGAFPEDRLVLDNRDTVAIAYTDSDYGSADPFDIESARIIHTVDGTPESVAAAIDAIETGTIPTPELGETFALTIDADVITGADGDDTINAIPAQDQAGTLIDTLQDVDILDGGAGTDTLNVTLVASNPAAKITDVENVSVRFTTNDGNNLDLIQAAGIESIAVQDSTKTGGVSQVGGAALMVANQTTDVGFSESTATDVSLTVDTVSNGAMGELNVNVDSSVPGTATSLTLNTTNSMVNVDSTNGSAAYGAATVNATGDNTVSLTGAAGSLGTLTVTGEGSVEFGNALEFDNAFSAVKTLTAEDGGVTVELTNNTPGNTAGGLVATTGAGEDDLTVRGGNVKTVSVGAGDDAVTTTGDPVLNGALDDAREDWNDAKQVLSDAEDAEDAAQQALNAANAALVAANQAAADAVDAAAVTQAAKDAAQAANDADNVTLAAAQVVQDTTEAAENAAQATRDAAENTRNNAQASVDDAIIADDLADDLVVTTEADADAALVTRDDAFDLDAEADALVATLQVMDDAVQAATTQLENDTATLAARADDAITDLERQQINNAFAQGAAADQAVLDDAVDVVSDLQTMDDAIQVAGDQVANNAATQAAFDADPQAITDAQRLDINLAYANGLITNPAVAQTEALAVYQPIQDDADVAESDAQSDVDNATSARIAAEAEYQPIQDAADVAAGNTQDALDLADADLIDADLAAANAVAAAVLTQDTLNAANAVLATAEDDLVAAETALAIAETNNNNAIAVVDAATATETQSAQVLTDAKEADVIANELVDTTAETADIALVTRNDAEVTLDDASQAVDDAQDVVDASYDDLVDAFDAAQTAGALGATSITDLGAGDDVLTLSNGFVEGAAIDAGNGADTLAIGEMEFTEVDGYAAAALAVVTGFETLAITDALQSTTYDVSTISGVTNFVAQQSVAGWQHANVTNLGADSTVTLTGNRWHNWGSIDLSLADDTASDTLNVVLNPIYWGNNDGVADEWWVGADITAQGIETLNFTSTATNMTKLTGAGVDELIVNEMWWLGADDLITLNVTGDAGFNAWSNAAQTKLTTVDASANTGGLWFDGQQTDALKGSGLTITGSATAS
ncbi:MAG: hypothetical protein DRQ56_04600, partial [Gammaproteobacteria bacterium]